MEIRCAVVGNVDAGKSTLLGVLTHGELDNGRGLARQRLFRHKHEAETGRTRYYILRAFHSWNIELKLFYLTCFHFLHTVFFSNKNLVLQRKTTIRTTGMHQIKGLAFMNDP